MIGLCALVVLSAPVLVVAVLVTGETMTNG